MYACFVRHVCADNRSVERLCLTGSIYAPGTNHYFILVLTTQTENMLMIAIKVWVQLY